MPSTYKVVEVKLPPREWTHLASGSINLDYDLVVSNNGTTQEVFLTQKPETAAPQEGQEIFGTVSNTGRGMKLKKERQDAQQSFSGGPQKEGPDEAYWERRNKTILREHSQTAALTLYELGRTEGVFEPAKTKEEFFERVRSLCDWLDSDVETRAHQFEAPPIT